MGAKGAGAKGRVEWVDAAKGVGILFVIAGHIWWQPGLAHRMIYAFHMPLFFILSGYMVKPQANVPLIWRQARSLFVPFIAFSLILIAADFLIEGVRGQRPIFPDVLSAVEAIVLRTGALRGPFTILWFIPCLFFARIAWNLVACFWPDPFARRWMVLIALVMAGGHWIAARTTATPLGLMAVPAAFTCYWIGQLWKKREPDAAMTLFLLAPLAAVTLFWLPPVNLKPGDFGMPVLSLAGAAAISIILCRIITWLPHLVSGPLAWLGRASLVIMYVHVAFIHYLTPYFGHWALFGIALAGSVSIHLAAAATRPGRFLLLGER
ncbi:MAG TPA: acyltransferase family protein [Sphingobium sp.]|uniref:acyltransferase family protein n=1 Tax=Sphingobium sp. TaxID=1912891 RepID=UPI002ED3EA29